MNKLLFILIVLSLGRIHAASCCVGGSTKSFIQLRNFEKYQLGISLSYKNDFAKYTPYGTLVDAKKKETFTSSIGGGMRLREDLDTSIVVPLSQVENSTGLGDIALGLRYVIVDPLYISDWYPKISLTASLKTPTGNQDGQNGNGIWEPGLGLLLDKDYIDFLVNFSAGYTYRVQKQGTDPFTNNSISVKEGDKIELSESVIVPLTESLSMAVGSSQVWELATQINAKDVDDSHGRSVQGFLSATYFFSRMWKMTAAFDSTLPVEWWGTTLPATRSVSLTSTYSIY